MNKKIFIIFLLTAISNFLSAQTITVYNNSTLQPLDKVTIKSEDGTKSVFTNEKGEAASESLGATKKYIITCIGYQQAEFTRAELDPVEWKVGLNPTSYDMNEVVISASRFEEKKEDVPNRVTVISHSEISASNPENTALLLENSGEVFLQHSQLGGGSPVMRGFEANKVLIVVDGVRMNNAIFRGGHLQNIITTDPSSLDNIELVFGPGSVVYGSDALGGVMHLHTLSPVLSTTDKTLFKANVYGRATTADQGMGGHVDFSIGTKKFGSITSVTYSDFGDLAQGNIRNPMNGDWGKRNFYQQWTGTGDTMIENSDPNLQVGTAYTQYDLMQKFIFKQNNHISHTLNFQYSTTTDIPRYDRLTEMGSNGMLSYGEWYYGPQKRLLGIYQMGLNADKGIFSKGNISLGYQDVEESRHSRRLNNQKITHRNEHVTVMSLNADFEKAIKTHELRYGLEGVFNNVESTATFDKLISGETGAADTRYPDGGSQTRSLAAYLSHSWEIGEKIIFSQGIRFSNNYLYSAFNDTTFFNFPFKDITQNSNAVTGNVGLVYKTGCDFNISLLLSSGFRIPNVDDMSKVFESVGGSLVVPNPDLKPENLYNAELTLTKEIDHSIQLEATGWYSMLNNALTVAPFTFNGADSINYDGVMSEVISTVNKNSAFVYGGSASINANVTKNFILYSTLTYTFGRIDTDTTGYPLDHVPPMFGKTGARLSVKQFSGEVYALYNGAKEKKNYNLLGEDNEIYSLNPEEGYTPSWMTLNARASFSVNKYLQVQLVLENILDQNYRTFASGISGSGRNLMVTLRGHW